MNLQPEVGKVYYVLLPGEERCTDRKVVQITERTVVLGLKDSGDYPEFSYQWFESRRHDTRYPLSSIRFVEEVKA